MLASTLCTFFIFELLVCPDHSLACSGADIVEVAPAYDHGEFLNTLVVFCTEACVVADITGIAAADLVHDFLVAMLTDKPPRVGHIGSPWADLGLL